MSYERKLFRSARAAMPRRRKKKAPPLRVGPWSWFEPAVSRARPSERAEAVEAAAEAEAEEPQPPAAVAAAAEPPAVGPRDAQRRIALREGLRSTSGRGNQTQTAAERWTLYL